MERDPESDAHPERTAPGPETEHEELIRQLELEGGLDSYPESPDGADCIYYLRTGFCGYGSKCPFNHPRDRAGYFMRTGACKFGASCKYHHPTLGGSSVPLNYFGYPLRPGEKECSYYMKTGQCKFGVTCKFHHPALPAMQVPAPSPAPQVAPVPTPVPAPTVFSTVQSPSGSSSQQYGAVMARPPMRPGSYVQGPYGLLLLSPGVPSWNPYPAPVNPGTHPPARSSSTFGETPLSPSAHAYTGSYQFVPSSFGPPNGIQEDESFQERPGQPECQYYMKTGRCKYGSSCRYHHPPEVFAPKADVILSPLGLPLRPGAPPCTHYSQLGVCKFGATCKFDHPMGMFSYGPSASSLADMPVAPSPVGSAIGSVAPPSLSLESRSEVHSGPSKYPDPAIMSSPVRTSSEPVTSVSSKGAPDP